MMKIVIVGDGKVGHTLTKILSGEGHDVTIIDSNLDTLQETQESLDVAVVEGNGALVEVQLTAGAQHSDLLIAATSSDEINLLCCFVARKLGCKNTVARVRNPEYDQQLGFLKEDLGLSFSINPEKAAAKEIFSLLQFPSFLKRDSFAKGLVELVEIRLKPDNILVGRRLDSMSDIWNMNALICAVERDNEVYIPSGSFCLQAEDKITVAAETAQLVELINVLKIAHKKVRQVMIIGGSRIAAYLAARLIKVNVNVTIIEEKKNRCKELSELLPKALVINGDGTEENVLYSEGIREMDAVVTLTGIDEENLVISMLANHIGVPKTITKMNRLEFTEAFSNIGVDTIVRPKLLTANEIVRYVRAVGAATEGDSVDTLYRMADGRVEALGFTVSEGAGYQDIPLADLELKSNTLIASIIRANHVIIPNGTTCIKAGDNVVVVMHAQPEAVSSLNDIFAKQYFNPANDIK
ncbi:MAG TPA: Trk system potassium transporter TrkA [Clostridia bacterium]|nr:Trk system potassium transporter TrkA [Clostridia bacterium]